MVGGGVRGPHRTGRRLYLRADYRWRDEDPVDAGKAVGNSGKRRQIGAYAAGPHAQSNGSGTNRSNQDANVRARRGEEVPRKPGKNRGLHQDNPGRLAGPYLRPSGTGDRGDGCVPVGVVLVRTHTAAYAANPG